MKTRRTTCPKRPSLSKPERLLANLLEAMSNGGPVADITSEAMEYLKERRKRLLTKYEADIAKMMDEDRLRAETAKAIKEWAESK